jgi:rSAM/selenodomain-associated transferase 2
MRFAAVHVTASAIDIVVPTLNAATTLTGTLRCLQSAREAGLVHQVIIVDGGSSDGTQDTARAFAATVIASGRGRGRQLARGAAVSTAPWLLFLHADTRLLPGWEREVGAFIRQGTGRAAVFRLRFDDSAALARWLERAVSWRTGLLGLPYGDQGLLISRELYDAVGGFRDMPLMEDVDLVRRLGRKRLLLLGSIAETSARRYRRSGYPIRAARNLIVLSLYFCGVPPRVLARLYG